MSNWKTTKQTKQCNVFPLVWAAIFGCKGEQTGTWRYTIGHFGKRDVEYACPTCREIKDHEATLSRSDLQQFLTDAQADAGVADYRTASVKRIKGVPTLEGGAK